jgi:Single domain von Willebrand factor type C
MMKSFFVTLIGLMLIADFCCGVSEPLIPNTRAEGCIEGTCGSHCAWDGAKIFPGDNLNQPGKCRLVRCDSQFNVRYSSCSFDMTGRTEWVGRDNSKPFPECCGRQVPKQG